MSDHTLLDHIVSQTRQNVELLMSHNRISPSDGRDILLKLPSPGVAGSVLAITQQTQRLSISPAPVQSVINNNASLHVSPKLEARAIWDWTSEVSIPSPLTRRYGFAQAMTGSQRSIIPCRRYYRNCARDQCRLVDRQEQGEAGPISRHICRETASASCLSTTNVFP